MDHSKESLVLRLFDLGVLQFGSFKLKSGLESSFYLDFRRIISYPDLVTDISQRLWNLISKENFDHICGVPYAALSLAASMSVLGNKPLIIKRKEVKTHGTKKSIEGVFHAGQSCLLVEDVISSGISLKEAIESLEQEGLKIKHLVAICDRMQGGVKSLQRHGYEVHCLLSMQEILDILMKHNKISVAHYEATLEFIHTHQVTFEELMQSKTVVFPNYEEVLQQSIHPKTKQLVEWMLEKKSNVCCAADVPTAAELLVLAEKIGPDIVALKIHADTLVDFSDDFVKKLKEIAQKHKFLIFEDRKIGDIGSVAQQQLLAGVHKIAHWADLVTVHAVAGSSSVKALKDAGKSQQCGIVLVCEMSTEDTLTQKEYINSALSIADTFKDVIVGVVAQHHRPVFTGQLLFTPGIHLEISGDGMGQSYNSPESAVLERGVDLMIVGRGIYKAENPKNAAELYKNAGWKAYLQRNQK